MTPTDLENNLQSEQGHSLWSEEKVLHTARMIKIAVAGAIHSLACIPASIQSAGLTAAVDDGSPICANNIIL